MAEHAWSEIEAIFTELLARPFEERERALELACGSDQTLRRELESLLHHATRHDRYFDDLARRCGLPGSDSVATDLAGRTVGSYRLERLLGRGGMGAVYLARRIDGDFELRAAVKLVAMGVSSSHARDRFLAERQILSRLRHPNIAGLFDGGVTEDGTPYFVMEYVDGLPIDRYCDERRLTVEARLQLFLEVCEAMEYAHRNLVVHRDLKPDNILVDEAGRAKLLDFGIARALDAAEGGFQTATSLPHPMTLAWASPEQVRGEPVSTGTDIYGLGLLLYRLLTGRHPYKVKGGSFAEVEQVVCLTDPIPPHEAVRTRDGAGPEAVPPADPPPDEGQVAEMRGTTVQRLSRVLAGDLGRVVLMALRKEPERRYSTVAVLAEDVRRYMGGYPVSARADTPSYRIRRFVERHRARVAGMAALVVMGVALVGLGVRYTLETRAHAVRIADEAAATAEVSAFLLDILRLADPGAGTGDTLTVRAALVRGVQGLEEGLVDRPELRSRMLRVMAEAYSGLGLEVDATSLLQQAAALQPETGQIADTALANTLGRLGESYLARGRAADALGFFRQAGDVLSEIGADSTLIATMTVGEGRALEREGQGEEARDLLAGALDVLRRADGPDGLNTLRAQLSYAGIQYGIGSLDSAVALATDVVEKGRERGSAAGPMMATALNNLAYYVRKDDQFGIAESVYREALDNFGRWIPPSQRVVVLQNLAAVQNLQGDTVATLATLQQAVDFAVDAWPEGNWRTGLGWATLAQAHLGFGQLEESEGPLREAVASYTVTLGADHRWTAGLESRLGDLLAALARPAEAEPLLLRAYEKLRVGPGPEAPETLAAAARLAAFYDLTGRTSEAARFRALAQSGT